MMSDQTSSQTPARYSPEQVLQIWGEVCGCSLEIFRFLGDTDAREREVHGIAVSVLRETLHLDERQVAALLGIQTADVLRLSIEHRSRKCRYDSRIPSMMREIRTRLASLSLRTDTKPAEEPEAPPIADDASVTKFSKTIPLRVRDQLLQNLGKVFEISPALILGSTKKRRAEIAWARFTGAALLHHAIPPKAKAAAIARSLELHPASVRYGLKKIDEAIRAPQTCAFLPRIVRACALYGVTEHSLLLRE